MKISIVIILLIVVAVLLCISGILADEQRKLFNYILGTKTRGVYQYINTSSNSFKKIKQYAIYRNNLNIICILGIIAIILILLIF